jgi:hypothetical protein
MRGRIAPAIVYGFSKDLRPDLKQLLFILSVTADGVPASFRCTDGNTSDSVTHIETWETLRAVAGRADFLYVADSKLCSYDNMQHIHRAGGRFVTVLPRSRQEDGWPASGFRPTPRVATGGIGPTRYRRGPRDRWQVFRPEIPSLEVWPITSVWSSLLTLHQVLGVSAISAPRRRARGAPPATRPERGCAAPRRSTSVSPRS